MNPTCPWCGKEMSLIKPGGKHLKIQPCMVICPNPECPYQPAPMKAHDTEQQAIEAATRKDERR